MIPLIDLKAQYLSIKDELDAALLDSMQSGQYILGPAVSRFEESLAAYLGVKHAIGLGSGTDALILALRALGIGAQDEVIVPAYTFFATAGAVMLTGAKPVFVDIDPATYQINASLIKDAITPRTKAILPVHLYGHPAEMPKIIEIAREYGLKVIEDNAQAFGAECAGRKTGSMGDIGCLSFFPTKNLGAFGDAGGIVTHDDQLAERVRMLRTHGWRKKYYSEELGYNSRLDALQASILQVKLPHVAGWNARRRELAARYAVKLADSKLTLPVEQEWGLHVYHLYIVRSARREEARSFLKERGVASEIYYPLPPHLTVPCRTLGYQPGDFPHAEQAANETFALPLYPEMTEDQQEEVIRALLDFDAA